MEIKAKRHEEQQRELEEEEENSVRNYPKKVNLFLRIFSRISFFSLNILIALSVLLYKRSIFVH